MLVIHVVSTDVQEATQQVLCDLLGQPNEGRLLVQ